MKRSLQGALGIALALLVATAPAALAQVAATATIYGKVADESGAVLPGATVTLSGTLGSRSTTSGSQGEYRFVNVDHGTHRLTAALSGFSSVTREVSVAAGSNVNVDFAMKVASVEETITVTAETPIVDTKKVGTSTNITKAEMSQIPSSRDPWALMRTIPGVLVDRVNVAGSESGQQSNFVGKGADPKDAVWSLDGVVITDMSAIGASPTYFTYDSFDEVNFSTGGNDVRMPTGGIGIGLVTRRGTNQFHGSAGGYFTHDDLQWSNVPDELASDARLAGNDKADHTEQINDFSFDLGGPVLKDKLWFYGSYGQNDIRIKNLRQVRDKTLLKNYTAKLNWQASANDMVSVFWFNGAKEKFGRAGSAPGLANTDGTFWDQGNFYPRQPHGFTKVEWNRVFSPNFFLNAKGSYYSTGFTLAAQGADDRPFVFDNVAGVAFGTADTRSFKRPMTTVNLDGNYFFGGAGGNHELRFGGSWRRADSETTQVFPGQGLQLLINPGGGSANRVRFRRDLATGSRTDFSTVYLSDTFTTGRLTLTAGLRYDRQTGQNLATAVGAHPLIPNELPGLDYAGGGVGSEWNDLSPRVGLTYALDDSRRTVLRASFARYAGQLSLPDAGWDNPLGTTFLEYEWLDGNGDRDFSTNERGALARAFGFDPSDPNAVSSVQQIDPDYHANHDTELVAGLERELAANVAVSAAYTWRRSTDLTSAQLLSGYYWYNFVGVDSSDYRPGTPVTARGFTATPYILDPAVANEVSGGLLLTNRPNYHRQFHGLELSLVKRLSNRWMARAALSWNDWREHFGEGAIEDPTRIQLDPQIDGGQVVLFGGASGKSYWVNAKWHMNLNALYQLPAGFEVSANLFGRQGYPKPYFLTVDTQGLIGFQSVLAVDKVDQFRYPNVWNLDLRLAKNIRLGGTNLMLSGEVFNALNANTEMVRILDATSTAFNRLDEIQAPRIARLGVRFTF